MVVPGIVTALAVSRQGVYLVAAIEQKLHLWQVSTGNLLRILPRHFQRVNCIKFTNDGSHFISGGADGLTLVWKVSSVLSSEIGGSNEIQKNEALNPDFLGRTNSAGVKDIYVGFFGFKARVAIVSTDQTCRVYQLSTRSLLLSISMGVELQSVSMDPAERFIFLGANSGDIYCISLAYCKTSNIVYGASDGDVFHEFSGHKKEVTCLSVSMDGQTLLSGSNDHCLKLWNIMSQTCIKTLECEGPITNAFLAMTPPVLHNLQDKKYAVPAFEFAILKRHLQKDDENGSDACEIPVPLNLRSQQLKTWDLSSGMDILESLESAGESENSKAQLKHESNSVKKTNEQMYYFLVDSFMSTLQK